MHRRAAGLTPLGRFFHLFASAAPGPRLASSRPRWPGARPVNSAAQPGMIILELELAALQAGHGGGKAQTGGPTRARTGFAQDARNAPPRGRDRPPEYRVRDPRPSA